MFPQERNVSKYFLIILLSLFCFNTKAQIISEGEPSKVEKKEKEVAPKKSKTKEGNKHGIEIYFGINPAYTFRTLKINEGLFSMPLGIKKDEKAAWTTSYFIGIRNPLNRFLKFDIGVGYTMNRETYDYAKPDSVYRYTNTYRHISVPIRIAYTYGDDIALYAGIGIIPKAFLSMKEEVTTLDINGEEDTAENIKKGHHFNLFLIDAVVDIGVQVKLGPNVGVFAFLEGKRQLTNNFTKQSPHIRKAYSLGFNVGLEVYL